MVIEKTFSLTSSAVPSHYADKLLSNGIHKHSLVGIVCRILSLHFQSPCSWIFILVSKGEEVSATVLVIWLFLMFSSLSMFQITQLRREGWVGGRQEGSEAELL